MQNASTLQWIWDQLNQATQSLTRLIWIGETVMPRSRKCLYPLIQDRNLNQVIGRGYGQFSTLTSDLFLSFYFLGWVPPTSTNHKLTSHGWVPPTSSSLSSAIPSRRPSVKDIVGYVKKFIYFYFGRGSCIMSLNILYQFYERKNIKHGPRLANSRRLKQARKNARLVNWYTR